jgi:lipoprotein-releasing system permease protein
MHIENFISTRYLVAKKTAGTSLITKVAIIGLILAVSSLITVLSVMNGFHQELRERVLNSISHGYIANIHNFVDTEYAQNIINSHPEVISSNIFIDKYALISYQNSAEGISVRGIEPKEQQVIDVLKHTKSLQSGQIIIGAGLANSIRADIGDKITLLTPKLNTSIMGIRPQIKRLIVADIFDGGVSEYDNSLAFIGLGDARALYKMSNQIDGIRLKVKDMFTAKKIIDEISLQLGENYYGISWQEQKQNFFTALKLEKRLMTIVLSLIIAVAVFNVISMMIMLIKDKKYDIAILRTFGLNARQIKKMMFYLGLKIGLFAISAGIIFGLILSYFIADIVNFIEMLLQTKFFPTDVFYISSFPSQILLNDILLVAIISFILVILSSIYPATNAAKINISTTLKEL